MSDHKNRSRLAENDESFQEKLKKEDQHTDPIPDEDMKKEEQEQRKGRKSKNDSSSQEKYNEDLRP